LATPRKGLSPKQRTTLLLLGVAIVAPLLALLIGEARVGRALERRVYDSWFTLRGPLPRPSDVVLVTIDVDSEESLGRYPWSRDWHTKLLENLHRGGARVVAFDATFADVFAEEDARLREALDATGLGILGAKTHVIFTRGARGFNLEEPAPLLRGAPIGIVDIAPDPTDGIIREYPIAHEYPQGRVPQLGVQAILQFLGLGPEALVEVPGGWELAGGFLPRAPGGGMLINFLGPTGSISAYSYASVVDDSDTDIGDWDLDIFEDFLDEGIFEGKLVLVGTTVPEHQDLHPTPFREEAGGSGAILTPGVEIHAHAVATILSGTPIRLLPWGVQYGWTLLLGLIVVIASPRARGLAGVALALILVSVAGGGSWYLFQSEGAWLWSVAPILSVGFSFLGSTVALYLAEEEEKARIRGMFQQYVAASVVDELIQRPELLSLGGEERVLSVLFSDVAGFSGISEHLTPTQLVELLNEYLTEMTEVILDEGGIIDKYQGDAIMAEFGAPIPLADHALRACRAALRMTTDLARLREGWREQGRPLLEARIGINTGKMLVGNLGSQRIMDYTVMGDQVNLASRLEGTNKLYGTEIMISEFTYEEVREEVLCRELDRIRVKGKQEPVGIFEVVALRSTPPSPERLAFLARFGEALALYRTHDFERGREAFAALHTEDPSDGPTALYLERCSEYLLHPPPPDWDGVFTMTTK